MLSIIFKRIMIFIPLSLAVAGLVGVVVHLVPGDPVDVMLGDLASEAERQDLRQRLGLDQSIGKQLLHFYERLLQGDLGTSILSGQPVASMIGERIGNTAALAITAMLVAMFISIPLGIFSAYKAKTFLDYNAMLLAMIGVAMPSFWIGPLLVVFFSIYLGILPVSGMGTWRHFVLPSLTMGAALAAITARMTRNTILDSLQEDFVRTALAKGLTRLSAMVRHVLRNASLPILTIIGLQFGTLLTGAVITERIYDWPGVGSLMLEGLTSRDYPVIQGCILIFSLIYLTTNLVVDILYILLDPRIKISGQGGGS